MAIIPPICEFGWQAPEFKLKGLYLLAEIVCHCASLITAVVPSYYTGEGDSSAADLLAAHYSDISLSDLSDLISKNPGKA